MGCAQEPAGVLLGLRQVGGAGEHSGDLAHALLALDDADVGLSALAANQDMTVPGLSR